MHFATSILASLAAIGSVRAHATFWHPSMYGFNVTSQTFPYDNRPQAPLFDMTFQQWWFHGHIGYPPHDGDVFEFPAGGSANAEIACDKGATSYWRGSEGSTDLRSNNYPCPGQPTAQFHTTGFDDVTGCAMAIADKANVHDVRPEDFTVFSTNRQCVWTQNTEFKVPSRMPACKDGICHCAWFWIHSKNSGSQQMYMTAFKCRITNTNEGARKIGKPALARRCGNDPDFGRPANPSNCTVGPKQPLYWYQKEGNTFFEDTYHPPLYNELYGFKDGAQEDIFVDEQGNVEGAGGGVVTITTSIMTSVGQSAPTTSSVPPPAGESTPTTSFSSVAQPTTVLPAPVSSSSSSSSSSLATIAQPTILPVPVSSSSSSSSSPPATMAPTMSAAREEANIAVTTSTPQKYKYCVRRTPEEKRKRALRRAAQEHKSQHRRRGGGLKSLFNAV